MYTICTVDGCDEIARAKGLCARHYTRLNRHGDAAVVNTRGRRRKEIHAMVQQLLRHKPDRASARFQTGLNILIEIVGPDGYDAAVRACTRPNGTVNKAQLRRMAGEVIHLWLQRFRKSTGR